MTNYYRFSLRAATQILAEALDVDHRDKFVDSINTRQFNVWVGEKYLAETNRDPRSQAPMDYTMKDVRRAIAYGRLQQICGAGIGKDAAVARDRIREMASWHTYGWVVASNHDVDWTDDVDEILGMARSGEAFAIIPCEVPFPA